MCFESSAGAVHFHRARLLLTTDDGVFKLLLALVTLSVKFENLFSKVHLCFNLRMSPFVFELALISC